MIVIFLSATPPNHQIGQLFGCFTNLRKLIYEYPLVWRFDPRPASTSRGCTATRELWSRSVKVGDLMRYDESRSRCLVLLPCQQQSLLNSTDAIKMVDLETYAKGFSVFSYSHYVLLVMQTKSIAWGLHSTEVEFRLHTRQPGFDS